jgi:hypothetical protein
LTQVSRSRCNDDCGEGARSEKALHQRKESKHICCGNIFDHRGEQ